MQYWTPAGNISVDFGPTLEDWTHVAVVVNADGMHVYANGEQIGTAGGGGAVSSGDTFNMGGDGVFDATGNWFLGALDDVAVWNIALSEDQIAALAAQQIFPIARSGSSTLTNGLTGYWPLDDGSGTTAANSGGGEDAQLYNGVEWVDDPDRGSVLSFDGLMDTQMQELKRFPR